MMILFRWLYKGSYIKLETTVVVNWLLKKLRDIWKWSATANDASSLSRSRARWTRWVTFLTEGIRILMPFMENPRALSYNEKSDCSSRMVDRGVQHVFRNYYLSRKDRGARCRNFGINRDGVVKLRAYIPWKTNIGGISLGEYLSTLSLFAFVATLV